VTDYEPGFPVAPDEFRFPEALDPLALWPPEFEPVSLERAAHAIREGNHLEAILHGRQPAKDRILLQAISKGWLAFAYSPEGRLRAQPTRLCIAQKFN
jgi:hypothetical protein